MPPSSCPLRLPFLCYLCMGVGRLHCCLCIPLCDCCLHLGFYLFSLFLVTFVYWDTKFEISFPHDCRMLFAVTPLSVYLFVVFLLAIYIFISSIYFCVPYLPLQPPSPQGQSYSAGLKVSVMSSRPSPSCH
jgi:hypothetical protein